MSSATRLQRLEDERQSLEAAYLDALKRALRDCAGGRWGLFNQNAGTLSPTFEHRATPESVFQLQEAETELVEVRERLGYSEPFPPMQRLSELRALRGANVSGEPKLAQLFLQELNSKE